MKIILRQDYQPLGKAGDTVTVKDGYARNYLIPQQIAVSATSKNIKRLEEERKLSQRRENKDRRRSLC